VDAALSERQGGFVVDGQTDRTTHELSQAHDVLPFGLDKVIDGARTRTRRESRGRGDH